MNGREQQEMMTPFGLNSRLRHRHELVAGRAGSAARESDHAGSHGHVCPSGHQVRGAISCAGALSLWGERRQPASPAEVRKLLDLINTL